MKNCFVPLGTRDVEAVSTRTKLERSTSFIEQTSEVRNPFFRAYLLSHRMRFVKENSGAVQIEEVGTNQLGINTEDCFCAFKLYIVA